MEKYFTVVKSDLDFGQTNYMSYIHTQSFAHKYAFAFLYILFCSTA